MKFFSPYLTEEYPNWWYDMPMVMYSSFEEYDFLEKLLFHLMYTAVVAFQVRLVRFRN